MAGRRKGKVDAEGKPLKTPQEILSELGLKAICERIIGGQSYRELARELGISVGSLTWWIDGDEERSHACACAREAAAQSFDEIALENIESASDPFELAKAREMATHLRWRAKAVNQKKYGDKQQLDVKAEVSMLYDMDQALEMIKFLQDEAE